MTSRNVHAPRPKPRTCVVLVGFMGSGKSSIGRRVAGRLGYDFADTDTLVSHRAGMPITEIFARHGETWFRDRETAELARLEGRAETVVATGGGIVTQPRNLPILARVGIVVWITASEDVLFERVSRNRARPLLHTENPRATMHALLESRLPLYDAAARHVIDNSRMRQDEVASRIIRFLVEHERDHPPPAQPDPEA